MGQVIKSLLKRVDFIKCFEKGESCKETERGLGRISTFGIKTAKAIASVEE